MHFTCARDLHPTHRALNRSEIFNRDEEESCAVQGFVMGSKTAASNSGWPVVRNINIMFVSRPSSSPPPSAVIVAPCRRPLCVYNIIRLHVCVRYRYFVMSRVPPPLEGSPRREVNTRKYQPARATAKTMKTHPPLTTLLFGYTYFTPPCVHIHYTYTHILSALCTHTIHTYT